MVGMVTTVPGRKVERRVGMGGLMGDTGRLSEFVPGTQHELWTVSHQVDLLLLIPSALGFMSDRPVCVLIWPTQ